MKTIAQLLTLITYSIILLISNSSYSAQGPSSFSVEQVKNQQSKDELLGLIKKNINGLKSDKSLLKTQYLPRSEHQQKKLMQANTQLNKPLSPTSKTIANKSISARSVHYYSFSIYQGYSQLIEDFDEDGYYQTFSVTFDADAATTSYDNQFAVYAELYLSKNGGPWIHYYTTEEFILYGESEEDTYEVYTTLEQGYPTDQYDVLIDLYEVGYTDIVASYSSDNTNDLYALPLESSDYDPKYIIVEERGGSYSLALLILLFIVLLLRKKADPS
ncbi:choice-of-anchor H family protein [Thalassotalea piscium]|uniref:GlyGly-CTERM sorting domain-containing protein n=1 Tax=Thalassotalea piscium TaxID=1230533 RepID=A0A7X0NJI4_9GAMM|nr:choice-of-anchor H family protein [Thalassotalea piscium]MBB6544579.1 hypothetical protein [Thalassotalea piscium]